MTAATRLTAAVCTDCCVLALQDGDELDVTPARPPPLGHPKRTRPTVGPPTAGGTPVAARVAVATATAAAAAAAAGVPSAAKRPRHWAWQ